MFREDLPVHSSAYISPSGVPLHTSWGETDWCENGEYVDHLREAFYMVVNSQSWLKIITAQEKDDFAIIK